MGKRPITLLLAAVGALACAAPSPASGLLSGVLPGLVSPADTPQTCDYNASQPFSRWGDTSHYVLVPGGSFEPGTPPWALTAGARIVAGNESFYVRSSADRFSLLLPAWSSATSPAACFNFTDWKMRFFAVGSGTVRVQIRVRSLLGLVSVLEGGTVRGGSVWRPSREVSLLLTNLGGLLATDSLSFRFTSVGSTSIRIDDVYLDPWKST